MQVRVLGQIEAIRDRPLVLGGPTQRRIIGLLALHHGDVVSVAQLVEVTWPGDDRPERAERNVHSYVHRLRSALGDDGESIVTVGAGYSLHLGDELDLERFERLASTARRFAEADDAAAAMRSIHDAEALWRGPPFGEFSDEAWALAAVARLVETHLSLRSLRVELLIAAGRPDEAVAEVDALVREHPYRERPRELQMLALHHAGRQVEALRAYQEFRRLLGDEVGVEPSPHLVELDRRIAMGGVPASATKPTRTIGSYELGSRIGEGAFAVVHRARQPMLGRDVAIKVVRAELANRPEFVRRFDAEAQMVARVEHPHVVPLYDYWREPDRAYLVMRLMPGGTLEERLDHGPLDLASVVQIVQEIGGALTAAHAIGVVHRDVKPENVMFDQDGRAYLADFGIALEAADVAEPEAALSEGSPLYASPEQLRRERVGPEADVHALAFVTYAMLVGHAPFADSTDTATLLHRQLHEPIPAIHDQRAEIPSTIDRVLARAAAKSPADRYPTAYGFAAAFASAATGTDDGAVERSSRPRSNPYKGLRAFEESDSGDFHGRRRLVDELVEAVGQPDAAILAVVGPSGSGKSSVVRAGLVPAIRAGALPGSSTWFVTAMTPGDHPYEALETALLRVAVNPPASLLDQLRSHPRGILRAARRILPDDVSGLLVVIDQFEELYTADIDPSERASFLDALVAATSEPGTPLRAVITLRADFYHRPLEHPELAAAIKRRTVTVTPLAPDELEHAIVDPARAAGVEFEPGVVAQVIADVNSQPGALPLLQYALTQAFRHRTGETIGIADYRAVGGITGALSQRAEELWRDATTAEQAAVRRLFGRLVSLADGTSDTRRRVLLTELGDGAATAAAIERYGAARLLTFDHDPVSRAPTVEVAHEALMREWPRLREWLEDDRDELRAHRHLTSATRAWVERDREPSELYRGARLEQAIALAASEVVTLNADERDFVEASAAVHQSEVTEAQRRARSQRRLVTTAAALTVLALIASAIALVQRGTAVSTAEAAALQRVMAEAEAAVADDRARGLLLALETYRLDPGPHTLGAIVSAASRAPRGWLGDVTTGRQHPHLGFLPDGTLLAVGGDQLERWDPERRELLLAIPIGPEAVSLDVATAAGTVVVANASGSWRVVEGDTLTTVAEGMSPSGITVARISADGTVVAIGRGDGAVELIAVAESAAPLVIAPDPDLEAAVSDIAMRPGGGEIAVAWGIGPPVQRFTIGAEIGPGRQLEGAADAELLVYGDDALYTLDTALDRFDIATGDRRSLPTTDDTGWNVFPGDRLLPGEGATVHFVGSGQWYQIDTATGALDGVQLAGGGAGLGGALSPDGRVIATGSMTGLTFWATDGAGVFVERVVPDLDGVYRPFHAISSDGTLAVQGGNVRTGVTTTIWDVTGRPRLIAEFPAGRAVRVTGNEIVTHAGVVDDDRTPIWLDFERWDRSTHEMRPLMRTGIEAGGQDIPLFVGDGRWFFHPWVSPDVTVDVWDTVSHERVAHLTDIDEIADGESFPGVPALAADGRHVILPSLLGHVAVYDTATWELVRMIEPADGFRQIAISGDGSMVVVETERGLERRDPDDLTTVLAGPVPTDPEPAIGHNLQITDDGRYVKTTGRGGAQIWDAATLTKIGRPIPHSTAHWSATLASSANLLATVIDDETVIWNLDLDAWPELACLAAGRNLTRDEWDEMDLDQPYHATCDRWPSG